MRALLSSVRLVLVVVVVDGVEEDSVEDAGVDAVEAEAVLVEVGRKARGLLRRTGDFGATNARDLLFSLTELAEPNSLEDLLTLV